MMSFFGRCFRLLRRYAKYLIKNEGSGQGGLVGMQDYIERQLTELHYVAVNNDFCNKLIAFVLAVVLAVLLPYLHIGVLYMKIWVPDKPAIDRSACTCYICLCVVGAGVLYMKIWVPDKPPIDRSACTCSCFDTIFRGSYENPGVVTYKHVYFNATSSTLKIWIFTAVFLLLFYESLRYLVGLIRSGAPLRRSMLFLYFVNLYPHYYSWWSFFSYYNEELYTYFTHHFMFTVTELLVTGIILNLCNKNNDFSSWKISAIITISVVHVIVSGMDQFLFHVIQGEGHSFQSARDMGLMIPDILHVLIPLRVFYLHVQQQKLRLIEICNKEEIILMVVFVSLGTLFGRLI